MIPPARNVMLRVMQRRYSCNASASFNLLNLKIGYTADVQVHPNSDKMYVSKIQLSRSDPPHIKQVCSGLRDFLPRDEFQDKLVVVVDNMKKCKLRGEVSEAMVLCGDDKVGHVQPCRPAIMDQALIGEQVVLENSPLNPQPTSRRIKTSEWEDVSSRLYVNADKKAVYRDAETGQEHVLCVYQDGQSIPIVVDSLPQGSPIR